MVEAARALIPVPVHVAGVVIPAAVTGFTTYLAGAALYALARRALLRAGPHWTERARAVHPHRYGLAIVTFAAPLTLLWQAFTMRGPLGPPAWLVAAAAMLAAYLAAVLWRVRLERMLGRAVTVRRWIGSLGLRWLVFFPHVLVAIAVALLLPRDVNAVSIAVFLAGCGAIVLAVRGGGFRVARALGMAPGAPERVRAIAEEAAHRRGVALQGVHAAALPEANAFALPWSARILFTPPLADALDDAGIQAICFHELAHIEEPARARWLRMSGLLLLVPLMAWRPITAVGGPWALLASLVAVLLFSVWLKKRLRVLETRADAQATREQEDEGVYARALETLYKTNVAPAVRAGPTHPDLYDRLRAAGVEPSYPKPKPPSGVKVRLAVLPAAALAVFLLLWPDLMRGPLHDRPLWSIACTGGDAWSLGALAHQRYLDARYGDAVTLLKAASALAPWWPEWNARAAVVLAEAGRREEARMALDAAVAQAAGTGRPGPWDDLIVRARALLARRPSR